DGGDGGKGGDVTLRAEERLLTLQDFRLKRLYEARNGQPGMGKDRYGAAAEDLVVDVPLGTMVHQVGEDGSLTLLADLTEPGQTVIVCRGGRGGRGNIHFKSSTRQAPRIAEDGKPGEEKRLRLELKILADVGIVGLPNAGKSTFISAVSRARPKIANYPFTTLTPQLGVVEDDQGRRLVLADIPGLIEGASQGAGLGHDFLKHVERTRLLLHLASVEDVDLDNPLEAFGLIDEELARFDAQLARKPQIRALNKIDLLAPDQLEALQARLAEQDPAVRLISARHGQGLEEIMDLVRLACDELDAGREDDE
ncbi:MAG: Obg family GTPase CgtA, partial [Desulfovibrionaceae bacterium]